VGYPMTWQRFIQRNGLVAGDYGDPPERLRANVNLKDHPLTSQEEFDRTMAPFYRERIEDYQSWAGNMVGDLRRLVMDSLDEGEVCRIVGERSGIDRDVVAGVLKEFFNA